MLAKLVAINCRYSHSSPAVFYLREALGANLPELGCEIAQLTINDPYYRSLLGLLAGRPDYFLFSVYVWSAGMIARLAADIQKARPDCRIICGGPEAPEVVERLEGAVLVRGEIEGVDPAFYRDLAAGSLAPVYQCDPAAAFPSPYRPEDFVQELADRAVYYESSRGCPFFCAYCLSSIERGVRSKDPGTVIAEIRDIVRHRPGMIRFIDRTFNADPGRALELWRSLAGLDGDMVFHFEVAPDLFTPEQMDFLATVPAGRFQFEAGIQSVNKKTLRAVNRRMAVDLALANLARLAAPANIHIHADLILGLPFEDGASFAESFNRVWASGAHHIQVGLLKVLPGTRIREGAKEFGLTFCGEPPYELIANRWLPQAELARLHLFGETFERFYNNNFFPSLWRYLRGIGEDAFSFFNDLFEFVGQGDFLTGSSSQARLCAILHAFTRPRKDTALIAELLLHDWLCCGMQHLPKCFADRDLYQWRRRAGEILPQNLPGLYDYQGRDRFLRRTVFYLPPPPVLEFLSFDPQNTQILAYLAQQEETVYCRRRVIALP